MIARALWALIVKLAIKRMPRSDFCRSVLFPPNTTFAFHHRRNTQLTACKVRHRLRLPGGLFTEDVGSLSEQSSKKAKISTRFPTLLHRRFEDLEQAKAII